MPLEVGQQGLFLGYAPENVPEAPILFHFQRVVCAATGTMGACKVFPVDMRGRIFSYQGETLFEGEVVPLAVKPVPVQHLPPPYGEGSVDYA